MRSIRIVGDKMKIDHIHISELFGDPVCENKIKNIARELSANPVLSSRVCAILDQKNVLRRAESLAGLYLLDRNADIPQDSRLIYGGGKPYFEGADIFFNISHSAGLAVCTTDSAPVGVDAEMMRAFPDRERLAERYFCAEEKEFIKNHSDRNRAFLRIWTRKEAYLKCLGCGLTRDLRSVNTLENMHFTELTVEQGGEIYLITAYCECP